MQCAVMLLRCCLPAIRVLACDPKELFKLSLELPPGKYNACCALLGPEFSIAKLEAEHAT